MTKATRAIKCSFCTKDQKRVKNIIAGPDVYICNDCVEMCVEIIREKSYEELKKLGLRQKQKGFAVVLDPQKIICLLPHTGRVREIFTDHISKLVTAERLCYELTADLYDPEHDFKKTWREISMAGLVLADVTGRDANVIYKLALAYTLGKLVILLSQSEMDVPAHLKAYQCLIYKDSPEGLQELEEYLAKVLHLVSNKLAEL